MRHKCGQAALEYLLTYGIAIMIVLIVLGILITYVPKKPERCDVRAPFICDPAFVAINATTGNLSIKLTNTAVHEYRVKRTECDGNWYEYGGPGVGIWPGEQRFVYFNCSGKTKVDAVPGKDIFEKEVKMIVRVAGGIADETIIIKVAKYY